MNNIFYKLTFIGNISHVTILWTIYKNDILSKIHNLLKERYSRYSEIEKIYKMNIKIVRTNLVESADYRHYVNSFKCLHEKLRYLNFLTFQIMIRILILNDYMIWLMKMFDIYWRTPINHFCDICMWWYWAGMISTGWQVASWQDQYRSEGGV